MNGEDQQVERAGSLRGGSWNAEQHAIENQNISEFNSTEHKGSSQHEPDSEETSEEKHLSTDASASVTISKTATSQQDMVEIGEYNEDQIVEAPNDVRDKRIDEKPNLSQRISEVSHTNDVRDSEETKHLEIGSLPTVRIAEDETGILRSNESRVLEKDLSKEFIESTNKIDSRIAEETTGGLVENDNIQIDPTHIDDVPHNPRTDEEKQLVSLEVNGPLNDLASPSPMMAPVKQEEGEMATENAALHASPLHHTKDEPNGNAELLGVDDTSSKLKEEPETSEKVTGSTIGIPNVASFPSSSSINQDKAQMETPLSTGNSVDRTENMTSLMSKDGNDLNAMKSEDDNDLMGNENDNDIHVMQSEDDNDLNAGGNDDDNELSAMRSENDNDSIVMQSEDDNELIHLREEGKTSTPSASTKNNSPLIEEAERSGIGLDQNLASEITHTHTAEISKPEEVLEDSRIDVGVASRDVEPRLETKNEQYSEIEMHMIKAQGANKGTLPIATSMEIETKHRTVTPNTNNRSQVALPEPRSSEVDTISAAGSTAELVDNDFANKSETFRQVGRVSTGLSSTFSTTSNSPSPRKRKGQLEKPSLHTHLESSLLSQNGSFRPIDITTRQDCPRSESMNWIAEDGKLSSSESMQSISSSYSSHLGPVNDSSIIAFGGTQHSPSQSDGGLEPIVCSRSLDSAQQEEELQEEDGEELDVLDIVEYYRSGISCVFRFYAGAQNTAGVRPTFDALARGTRTLNKGEFYRMCCDLGIAGNESPGLSHKELMEIFRASTNKNTNPNKLTVKQFPWCLVRCADEMLCRTPWVSRYANLQHRVKALFSRLCLAKRDRKHLMKMLHGFGPFQKGDGIVAGHQGVKLYDHALYVRPIDALSCQKLVFSSDTRTSSPEIEPLARKYLQKKEAKRKHKQEKRKQIRSRASYRRPWVEPYGSSSMQFTLQYAKTNLNLVAEEECPLEGEGSLPQLNYADAWEETQHDLAKSNSTIEDTIDEKEIEAEVLRNLERFSPSSNGRSIATTSFLEQFGFSTTEQEEPLQSSQSSLQPFMGDIHLRKHLNIDGRSQGGLLDEFPKPPRSSSGRSIKSHHSWRESPRTRSLRTRIATTPPNHIEYRGTGHLDEVNELEALLTSTTESGPVNHAEHTPNMVYVNGVSGVSRVSLLRNSDSQGSWA